MPLLCVVVYIIENFGEYMKIFIQAFYTFTTGFCDDIFRTRNENKSRLIV